MQKLSNLSFTTDPEIIKKIILTHGHAAEHNYSHYLNIGKILGECAFTVVKRQNDAKGVGSPYGIMSYKENNKTIWCYSDPLAPEKERLEIFFKFVEWALKNGFTKVRAEINEKLWEEVVKTIKLKYNKFRAIKPSYVYQWPVYDLKKLDPSLPGIHWKNLRNMRNAFIRDHKVEIIGNENASQQEMLKLLEKWKKMRQGNDRAHIEH